MTGVSPARHSVLFNGLLTRSGPKAPVTIEPWRDKREMVMAPTVYDVAYQAGLTTAQVDWVAIQNPGTITWAFPERPSVDGAIEKEIVEAGIVTTAEVQDFAKTVITRRDQIWTNAALHILKTHKPRLLLLHYLTLDSVQHSYGPGSLAASSAHGVSGRAGRADRRRDRRRRTAAARDGDRRLRSRIQGGATSRASQRAAAPGGSAAGPGDGRHVRCLRAVRRRHGDGVCHRSRAHRRAAAASQGVVQPRGRDRRGARPCGFPRLGMPDPDKNTQMADLMLIAAEGYGFGVETEGDPVATLPNATTGRHGYVSSDPT